ncbi:esterase-like activity of phytase family protein [Pseudomonas saudiphocaensis]|uniref:esterase-like activity of phytase family protein n=1 Tax=Pseudomonas saudiphocaensis TaxID=1499686 RepID=UPI00187D1D46|nr:esterase-like activity of phytase family protein [Pseudomonas saudiphocaensis]MBE7927472.1 esterase-like activity of phytase family protein [Pseudomonas saudiphocaensis]
MNWRSIALLLALAAPAWASETNPELELVSEHPVAGMETGNLSGMAWCGDGLWVVSDREDNLLYRLDAGDGDAVWQAQTEHFELPPVPDTGLPWGMRMRTQATGMVRGGQMDFEGLACDRLGNRYLVSEAHAAVLRVSPAGTSQWLNLPSALIRQARASGMLLKFNAMFEGIAVDPDAGRMWLAAERERRGLLVMHRNQSSWQCTGGCVLLVEGGNELPPPALGERPLPISFSALAYFNERLFTLEPNAHRVCRRNLASGKAERCWSYAATALADSRRYDTPFGNAEALSLDEQGAWIGVDNNAQTRADGEKRPIVWRFATPPGGWSAK